MAIKTSKPLPKHKRAALVKGRGTNGKAPALTAPPVVKVGKLTDAIQDPRNANKGTEYGLALIEKSIRQRGIFRPIAAAGKGVTTPVIKAGNKTQLAAVNAGMDEAIFVYTDGTRPIVHVRTDIAPDSKEADTLGIEDNSLGFIDYNPDGEVLALLAAENETIAALVKNDERAAKALMEAAMDEPHDAEPQIDRAAELNKKWKVERGQLWRIGEHRLLCGDSTSAEDVARVMGGEKCYFVCDDPPYNFDYHGGGFSIRHISKEFKDKLEPLTSFDPAEFLKGLRQLDYGAAVIFTNKDLLPDYFSFAKDNALIFNLFVWVKDNPPPFTKFTFLPDIEYAVWIATNERHFENGLDYKSYSKWFNSGIHKGKSEGDNLHPTIKPLEFIQRFVMVNCPKDGATLDHFAGSGTTLVACQNLSRRCRAIEISPNYCAVILERMATAFPGLAIERIEPNGKQKRR